MTPQPLEKERIMFERTVTSLAILQVNWDKHQNYIDNFVPFVAEIIKTNRPNVVTTPEIQAHFKEMFRINIPQNAIKSIINRAVRVGLLNRVNRHIEPNFSEIDKVSLQSDANEAHRKYEALVSRFIEFAREHYEQFISKEDAEISLVAFVDDNSVSILTAAIDGHVISKSASPSKRLEYLASSFIEFLSKEDPIGFEFLVCLVKGAMLANTLFMPDITQPTRRLTGIQVYIDTNLALRALGLAGGLLQEPCTELISLLADNGARICVFSHTFDEMYGILNNCAMYLRDVRNSRAWNGETLDFLVESRKSASDVEYILSNLRESLNRIGVHVVERPEFDTECHKIYTQLSEHISSRLNYYSEGAFNKDIDSIISIYKLRNHRALRNIEDCRAIFVTNNRKLSDAALDFNKEVFGSETLPLCVMDYHLSTVLWLKNPLNNPMMPRKRIIANCYAALNPQDSALWKQYVAKINHLKDSKDISVDDYLKLRFSLEVKRSLMNVTLGEVDALTEGTVKDILAESRDYEIIQANVAYKNKQEEQIRGRVRRASLAAGKIIANLAFFLISGVAIIGLLLVSPKPFSNISTLMSEPLSLLAMAVLIGITICGFTFGLSVNTLKSRLTFNISGKIEQILLELALKFITSDEDSTKLTNLG